MTQSRSEELVMEGNDVDVTYVNGKVYEEERRKDIEHAAAEESSEQTGDDGSEAKGARTTGVRRNASSRDAGAAGR